MNRVVYPFAAVVEQEAMKTALLLNAIDPTIGGVLIRGAKGTGKSTAARAIARLLPQIQVVEGCPFHSDPRDPFLEIEGKVAPATDGPARTAIRPMPFVELPLNATEDRLVGTLHFEKAIQTGQRQFEPGLLAAANRGILYVDEVNLLEDHLVDRLLDAAASGINIVEREGISVTHPARFILIGTMNPEEGELRPQFLDRFGLCANIERIVSLASREAIVRRRLAFENDPEGFRRQWEHLEQLMAGQMVLAQRNLNAVTVPDPWVSRAVRLAHDLEVQGHRADIVMLKAARAHAAFLEKSAVEMEDFCAAARLALTHRLRHSPLDAPERVQENIHGALQHLLQDDPNAEKVDTLPPGDDWDEMAQQMQVPGAAAAGSLVLSFLKKKNLKPSGNPTSV